MMCGGHLKREARSTIKDVQCLTYTQPRYSFMLFTILSPDQDIL